MVKLLYFYGIVVQHYQVMALSEVTDYSNLSVGIVTAMMANIPEDWKVKPLHDS